MTGFTNENDHYNEPKYPCPSQNIFRQHKVVD